MTLSLFRRQSIPAPVFLALILIAGQAFAALDLPMIFEIRQTGADTSAGGFTRGGTIAAPTIPTVTPSASGGTVAAATYYCVITYTDAWGETVISPQQSAATSGATASITVTSPSASTGAKTWSCYFGTTSGGPYFPQGTGLTIGANRTVTTTPPTTGTQPKGVDYSVQDSPQINVADGVANGTTTFTSATAAFTGAHVGNLIRVGASTWRRIVGVTNATTVVLDATVGSASSLPVVVGGAFATPGMFGAVAPTSGSALALKYSATPYGMSASTNVSGGSLTSLPGDAIYFGYETTRLAHNTDANRPTIKPTANSVTCFSLSTTSLVNNIIIANPDSKTSCTFFTGQHATISNCKISGIATYSADGTFCVNLFNDISCSTVSSSAGYCLYLFCDIHDGAGLSLNLAARCVHCNFYNITTTAFGVNLAASSAMVANCNFYHLTYNSGTVTAISITAANCTVLNSIVEDVNPASNIGYAFGGTTGNPEYMAAFINCYSYNIKTAQVDPATIAPGNLYGATALSASPFTLPGSGNFALNSTVGGGAVVRNASLPTVFPAGTTNNYLDAGAADHQDPTGGGFVPGPIRLNSLGPRRGEYRIKRKAG